MAKEFFKEYLAVRQSITADSDDDLYKIYGDLNRKCLSALEKYVYSYKWCRNDTERQIFENVLRGEVPNKMQIKVKSDDGFKILKSESVRSASSRISRRLYKLFGSDCFQVMLSDSTNPDNERKLHRLINICISLNDDYIFRNHYSVNFDNMLNKLCKEQMNVTVPEQIKFSKDMLEVLTIFKLHDSKSTFSQLKSLDTKSLSLVYKILSQPEYVTQRAEILEFFDSRVINPSGITKDNEVERLRKEKDQLKKELEEQKDKFNRMYNEAVTKIKALRQLKDKE